MSVYLRYGKIKGEVKEPAAYRGWIELQSFQWGVGRSVGRGVSSPTGSGSSPSVSEVTVTRRFDSVSALLQNEALQGEGVVAIVDFVKEGHVYLRFTLTDTMISSYSLGGSGDKPMESMSLNFTKVESKLTPGGPPPPP